MRRSLACAGSLVLVAVLSAGCGRSPVAQGTFPLKSEDATGRVRDLASYGSMPLQWQDAKPDVKRLPKDLGEKPLFAAFALGRGRIVLAKSRGADGRLWADTNADGDLADETPVPLAADDDEVFGGTNSRSYGPVTLMAPGGAKVRVVVGSIRDEILFVSPASVLTGVIRAGGKEYAVAFVDATYDGKISPMNVGGDEAGGLDQFAVDLNGNGTFADEDAVNEVMPMPRILRLGDAWYSLRVAADGASVAVEKVEPKLGTLDLGTPGAEADFMSDAGNQTLKGGDGKFRLPEGFYVLTGVKLFRADKAGKEWALSGYPGDFRTFQFTLSAGQTVALKLGPPLKATVRVADAERRAEISLAVTGQGGETYSGAATADGKRLPAPAVRIYDERGQEIASDKMEYG